MENPIEILKLHFRKHEMDGDCMENTSVLDLLFYHYISEKPPQTDAIRAQFQALECCMEKLSLEENDQVSNLVCQLCAEHARCAFLEGIHTGYYLRMELQEK